MSNPSDRVTDRPLVRYKALSARATLPKYQTELAAGMDLHACLADGEMLTVPPGEIIRVPLGFAVALPPGYEAQIRPRSGLATKSGITVPNSPGTVDADYRGEMVVALINLGREPFVVRHGDRVAQMVLARHAHAEMEIVTELDETSRGAGGFGSTGI